MSTPHEPQWKFRPMQAGEMNIDPFEGEFFSTEALENVTDALVRETIQNSLDARLGTEPVRVRFRFSGPNERLSQEAARKYFAGLNPHLLAAAELQMDIALADGTVDFLAIEDYGTRGLQGDPAQQEDAELNASTAKNDFYYFWRNIGRSVKSQTDLGRWGLGKTVFQGASRVKAFFGLTVQAGAENEALLLGQSVLRIHKVGAQRHCPYGYFGRFDEYFALPVSESAFIERFCADFRAERLGQPGLSVVIPFPDSEIEPDAVLSSVLRHYFFPILAGRLIVEIAEYNRARTLASGTLLEVVRTAALEPKLGPLLALSRWGLDRGADEAIRLEAPSANHAPNWRTNHPALPGHEALRDRFNDGKRLSFQVPVWVKPTDGTPTLSKFNVYVERADALTTSAEHFVRDGITIAGVRSGLQTGVRAIVSVTDDALSQLLGDAENPAHTEWQERSPKFRGRYQHGPTTLRFVKNAPKELVALLTRPAEGIDKSLLHQLFPMDFPTADSIKSVPSKDPGKGESETSDVEANGKGQHFQIQKISGGFRIRQSPSAKEPPSAFALALAYEVRRGNPFRQYQPPDFELDKLPIRIATHHAEVMTRRANLLTVRLTHSDFTITVTGFDPHRDIRVKLLPPKEVDA
jgi:hypothetical protein